MVGLSHKMGSAPDGGWRRPVRRVLSIGFFFVVWHYSTKWDIDLYVRFQNIPTPWEVLEEAGIAGDVVPVTYMNSSADIKAFVGRHGGCRR